MEDLIARRILKIRMSVARSIFTQFQERLSQSPKYVTTDKCINHFDTAGEFHFALLQDQVNVPNEDCDEYLHTILPENADFEFAKLCLIQYLETRDRYYVERMIGKKKFFNFSKLDVDIALVAPRFVLLPPAQYDEILSFHRQKMVATIQRNLYHRFFQRGDRTPANVTQDNYQNYLIHILRADFKMWTGIPFDEIHADFRQHLFAARKWL